jgi:hypothetical protein
MPLIRINAQGTALAGLSTLGAALDALPSGAQITVMIHGYSFSPRDPRNDPHSHILSMVPVRNHPAIVSWPRRLHGSDESALAIAFGWEASGTIWRAWDEADRAGAALAHLLEHLHAAGRRADVVAHSLGARVVLSGLRRLKVPGLRRAILIAPAEFRDTAEASMESPAGRAAQVLNVASRENDLFDALLEWLVAPFTRGARTLGNGLSVARDNWTDLQIDDSDTLSTLARLGHRIAPPARRICHWSGYLRPGLFPLYRAVLSGALPLPVLRAALPETPTRRWSRLLSLPTWPLPRAAKAPS